MQRELDQLQTVLVQRAKVMMIVREDFIALHIGALRPSRIARPSAHTDNCELRGLNSIQT